MNSQLSTPESNALSRICNEWYVSFGLMTLVVVISFWASPLWMPLYELALAVLLALWGPGRKVSHSLPCGRITSVTVYTLMGTGLVSFVITVAYRTEFVHLFFDISTLNHSIPYITSLIIFPISTVIAFVATLPRVNSRHARNCHLRNQYNPKHPMFGRVVHGTYRSLLRRLAIISAIISVIDWAYYFICYRNVSINKPDSFFFFVVPAAIYAWSIINVRREYSMLSIGNGLTIHAVSDTSIGKGGAVTDSVIIRYLVVWHDRLLLDVSEQNVLTGMVDTPFIEVKSQNYEGDEVNLRADFEKLTGITAITLKPLYVNENQITKNRIYHVLVHINDAVNTDFKTGQWIDLNGVNDFLQMGVVSAPLNEEIFRIYTIAMAWKTYTAKGERRYPIRNYKPTFRLEDLPKYDVDYSDARWLKVSRINQDSRWWWLRKHFL